MMRRTVLIAVWALALIGLLVGGAFALAQTGFGQRLIAKQLGRALSDAETTVEVRGLSGLVPFDVRIERIRLFDRAGLWLELDDLAVVTSPRALLHGRVEVHQLRARRLALLRLPAATQADAEEDEIGTLPEMPRFLPPVAVRSLGVDRLEVDAAVLGQGATFTLSGALSSGASGADLSLDLQRTDQPTARATLDGRLDLADQTLALNFSAVDKGDLLAGMTGRPEIGEIEVTLSGTGPLANWQGDLRVDAQGLARADAKMALALTDTTQLRVAGQLEPAPGALPTPADALIGERVQLALTATRTDAARLAIDDLRATTALVTLSGSGKLDLAADRLVGKATVRISDLAPLETVAQVPLAGALDVSANVDGALMQPKGRLSLVATDLAAGELGAAEVRTTLDLTMLDRIGRRGARLHAVAAGSASALRLPADVRLPLQSVQWQGELTAPVDRMGRVLLDRLTISADHLTLSAEGSADATTLGGEAQVKLALDALAPFAQAYGQPIAGAAEFDANLQFGAGAQPISIDLYGQSRELSGLPEGLGALIGAAPNLQANAIVAPEHGIEITHLRVEGTGAALDGRLDMALPARTLDGALSLNVPQLAPLSPAVGVDLDGPLTADVQLGGAWDAPKIELTVHSPGLLVAGEHLDALALISQVEGTPEHATGKLGLALTARGLKAELATALELRGRSLRLAGLRASAPDTRLAGDLSLDLERRLVEGQLDGRIGQLQAFAPLLPGRFAGAIELQARASAPDGSQTVALTVRGKDVTSDFGRLAALDLHATAADLLGTPRITADLTLADLAQGEAVRLAEGTVRAQGTPAALAVRIGAKGEAQVPYDVNGRLELALEEPLQVRIEQLEGQIAEESLRLAAPATVTLAAGTIAIDDLSLRLDQAQLNGGFSLGPQQVAAEVRLERLPLALVGRFGGPDLRGQMSGRLSLQGPADNPSGTVRLDATGFALASPAFADVPAAELGLSGTLSSRRLRLHLRGEGLTEQPIRASAELPLVVDLAAAAFEVPREGEVAGRLNAEIALAQLAEIAALDDQRLEGPLRADLTLGGTVAEPSLDGTVRIDDAIYENGASGTVLRNVNLLLRADRRIVRIERFSATDGGQGRLSGGGRVELDPAAGYPIDVQVQFQEARLVALDDVVASASGNLALRGSAAAPRLSGEITVNRAEVSIPDRVGPTIAVVQVQEVGGDSAASSSPDGDGSTIAAALGLDLTVKMPSQVFVRGRGLDSEWQGELRIQGTAAKPVISGTLQLRRGRFELLGRPFNLTRGNIAFTGESPPNPTLDIEAVVQAVDITAVVTITGQARAPEIKLDSQPSLPEDEIVSRLLFNRAASGLGPADAVRLAAAVNTLRGGGPGLLGQARQTLGLDTLDISGEGLGDAEVRAGRYLNDRVFVEVGTGAAANSEDVRIEVEILPNLSLDADTNAQAQSGVGLRWRFDY